MPETVTGLPAGYRTTSAKVMRILAMAVGTLAVVQFALAGYGAFSSVNKQDKWGAHETMGNIIGILTVLVLIAALISRPGRRPLAAAIVLCVVAAPLQPILAELGKDHGTWWGAVHALGGIIVLGASGAVSRKINATPPAPAVPAEPSEPNPA